MKDTVIKYTMTASAMIFLLCAAVTVGAEQKIGFVRTGYIMSKHEPYKAAMKKFEELEREENNKFKNMTDEFQKKVDAAQKQAAFMSQDTIVEKSKELERENALLEEYSAKLFDRENGILANKYKELLHPIFDHVNKMISKVRVDEGYAFIFEAESETLIDADEQFDLSDKVLAVLEKEPYKEPNKE